MHELEDVVMSGLSCRLPESDNMAEFRDNLMNGVDMVTENDRRWKQGVYGLPKGNGKLKDISKFDNEFFGVSPKQADTMDPQMRLLLEVAYEAIVDAGQCPEVIKGSNTGVFIGAHISESQEAWSGDPETVSGYTMTGCFKSMLANRLSYYFDFKGPSFVLDAACAASCLALHYALQSIRSGRCDAALVGGSNLCLKPSSSVQFLNLGMLAPDGRCKSFDAKADGYCRSEGVVVLFLQRAKSARRIYCHVVNTGNNNDGAKLQGIWYPSSEMQLRLLTSVYNEVGLDPSAINYLEAHGTGTQVGDTEEVKGLADFFCRNRKKPLLIGSVKSNMGHCELASGLAAVAKVIIAMEERVIPGNLHCNEPNPAIPSLSNGQLNVVNTNTPWTGGYVGINNFGFGGSNCHVILKSHDNTAVKNRSNEDKKLLCYHSRTEEGVRKILQQAQCLSTDDNFLAFLSETVRHQAKGQTYRGFRVLNASDDSGSITLYDSHMDKRPVWYVFTGMGCQWPGMGRQMMSIEVFRKAIFKCEAAVYPYGIELTRILMCDDESMYGDVIHAFVAIVAIQVAIVDLLSCVGVKPDGIIGHSIGEIGCAYADGCFTAEEAVLVAYWRGRCIKDARLPPGKMAVVGLTWNEALKRCPDDVVPACHNASDNVTISGPRQAVESFVHELKRQNVFTKEVNSVDIAFHSYLIKAVETSLYDKLSKVITHQKQRSRKWISTSIKQSDWRSNLAKYSSSEYHVNNVLSPVLFHEALQHVSDNAVVIEIAPHCLLKSILKRSLSRDCHISGLMQKSHSDNVEFCLSNLGHLFLNGVSVNPQSLLEPASYPVQRRTPMLAPLISWKHDKSWQVPRPEMFVKSSSEERNCFSYRIDTSNDSEFHYLSGHQIDGRVLFPAAGYLLLAWKSYIRLIGKHFGETPVSFENVRFHRATILPEIGEVQLEVTLMPGTGTYQINEGGSVVASGRILETATHKSPLTSHGGEKSTNLIVLSHDVYKELRIRGYEYEGLFKGILQTDLDGRAGILRWSGNFVTFLDTMLQMIILSQPEWDLRLPTSVKSISIEPQVLLGRALYDELPVEVDTRSRRCISGGIEIAGLTLTHFPWRKDGRLPIVDICTLLPHDKAIQISFDTMEQKYGSLCLQLAFQICASLSSSNLNHKHILTDALTELKPDVTELGQTEETEEEYKADKFTLIKAFRLFLKEEKTKQFSPPELLQRHACEFRKALTADGVFSFVNKPEYLKVCIDTVVQNQNGNLDVLEVGAPKMKDSIVQLLSSFGDTTFSYDVLDLGSDIQPSSPISKAGLIVVDNMLHIQKDLRSFVQNIAKSLDDDGFVLIKETTRNFHLQYIVDGFMEDTEEKDKDHREYGLYFSAKILKEVFDTVGLLGIYEIHNPFLYSLFLLRKRYAWQPADNRIVAVSSLDCNWVEDLKKSITELKTKHNSGGNIWLYADNNFSGVVGMVNCLMKEPGGHKIRCVLKKKQEDDIKMEEVVDGLIEKNLSVNIVNEDGVSSYRFLPCAQEMELRRSSAYSYLDVICYGDLSSLTWFQTSLQCFTQNASHTICRVKFASLNFRDVMLATGKLNPDAIPGNNKSNDCLLGMEFSGTDSKGNNVMGIVSSKALSTHVDVRKEFLWEIPDDWSLNDAASVPVAYSTAYYALIVRGQLNRGQSVLIHSGSGGVGQAAIRIAQSYDCEVFTTIGTEQKRAYLLSVFPKLKAENIFSSRDTSFESGIMDATSGNGVDIVLNSLSGEKLQSSLNVVAQHGCFLEIGKFDLFNDSELGMSVFLKNISFHGILLDSLFENGNKEWKRVHRLVMEGIKDSVVEPLSTTVFDSSNIEAAFRYMAHGKHIGKIIIKVGVDDISENVPAVPKFFCDAKKSYVIVGGLGGFGLELAHWLTNRGARSILLTSRSGIKTGYQARKIRRLQNMGTEVVVCRQNAGNIQEAEEIIKKCSLPCGGIFNTAMVLEDGLIENQTVERFQKVIEPKLTSAINLDKITRRMCKNSCDCFVMFSSVSSGRGNAGQSNYGFANSGMERICEQRKRDGLHGLAIQWGVIGDVGVVFEKHGKNDTEIAGVLTQRLRSCLASLDIVLTQSAPVVTSYVSATNHSSTANKPSGGTEDSLLNAVCNIIGINDSSKIDKISTLENLGMDSLMTVEIKQTIERMTDVQLGTTDIRSLTIQKIQDMKKERFCLKSERSVRKEDERFVFFLSDMLVPTDIIVPLNMQKTNVDALYIIHMTEGTTRILRHMASFVERPVFGIQCTKEVPQRSVPDMAKYYLEVILGHNNFQNFHLSGYSFGGMVSLEIGYQMQQSEATRTKLLSLTLLDGSQLSLTSSMRMFQQTHGMKDHEGRKTMTLAVLAGILLGEEPESLWQALNTLSAFDERVEMLLAKLRDNKMVVSKNEWLSAVDAYNQRISITLAYKCSGTYTGDVVLIAPDHWTRESEKLGSDQGLKQIVNGSVKVYHVPGGHFTFLQDSSGEQVAQHINDELKK